MMMNIFAGVLAVAVFGVVGFVWWHENHGAENKKDSDDKK